MYNTTKLKELQMPHKVIPTRTLICNALAQGNRDTQQLSETFKVSTSYINRIKKEYLSDRGLDEHYFMTQQEIATELGISNKSVSRIEKEALAKMNKYISDNGLEEDLREVFTILQSSDGSWNIS